MFQSDSPYTQLLHHKTFLIWRCSLPIVNQHYKQKLYDSNDDGGGGLRPW